MVADQPSATSRSKSAPKSSAVATVGTVGARCWGYRGGFLIPGYRRRRDATWRKRARYRSAIPDVGDSQDAARDRPLTPSAQRGPERYPVCRGTEALRGAPASSSKGTPAPDARRRGRGRVDRRFGRGALIRCFHGGVDVVHTGSKPGRGSSPRACRPAAASRRQRLPKASRQPSPCAPSRCTRLSSAR